MNLALTGRRLFDSARHALDASRDARDLPRNPGQRRRAQARAIQRLSTCLAISLGIDVRPIGPLPVGRVLMVSNHLSYLDSIVLGALVPAIPIAKRELLGWPVIGPRVAELGAIFVDRDDVQDRIRALRQARRALLEGASVLNFPEGTTTRGDIVFPFRRGIFGIARALRVPIVPVRIEYHDPSLAWVDDETFLPHFLRLTGRTSAAVEVRFGAQFVAGIDEPARAIGDRCRKIITRLHLD